MRKQLLNSMKYNQELDVMYQAKDGSVSKRRIKVLQVNDASFRAFCYLRKSKRTFRVDNVLALVPVTTKESMVI